MPAAALIIGVIAVETGVALAIGTAVAGVVGATVSVGVATAIGSGVVSAGLTAAQGGSVSDVLKSAVIGGVASYVGASVAESVTTSITSAAADAGYTSIAGSIGKVAGAMAGGGTQSATGALLTGGDPIEALIKGGLTAGLTSGVMEGVNFATSKIPGFSDLGKDYGKVGAAAQRAITAGLTAGALGKDVDKAVLNSALGSVLRTGSDYIKTGIKDLSSSLQTAYNDATTTGKSLEDNIKQQEKIVTAYNTASDAFNTQHNALKSDYDKYVDNKDGYDNYAARMAREGNHDYGDYESGPNYGKFVGGTPQMVWDEETGGQVQVIVGRKFVPAPTKDAFLAAANQYAGKVNAALPAYEEARTAAESKLTALSTELDGLKAALPTLEKTFVDQKTALNTAVTDFQKQEEANAQFITNLVKDTTDAKTSIEQATGEAVTDAQLDKFLLTGDVKGAAAAYIDTNTTDRAEAEAALNSLGYTATSGEIESLVGRTADADLADVVGAYVDPRQVTVDEARASFQDTYGYTPTDAELGQFTGQFDEASTLTNIGTYVDPRQLTKDEFAGYAGEENFFYDPADEDFLNQYVGQRDEASTTDLFRKYADPLATTSQEAIDIYKQQYADMYGVDAEDVSNETVAQFMEDTGNTAESAYTGGVQNQLSKDLGFDDYADRTYAAESMGEQRPDSSMWEDFQTTSGVVGMEGSGIMPTQFVETDQAAELLPEVPGAEEVAAATPDETNEQTADQVGAEPDFAQTLAGMMEQEQPTGYGPGVQVAAAPVGQSDIMSDVGPDPLQSIGLQNTPEQPVTRSADTGIVSLLSAEPEQAEKPESALATTEGSSVYNALTGADTTGTIAERVLESNPDAIQTGGVYSGAENEIAAGDTITQRYLGDTSKEQQGLEDVGLTGVTSAAPSGRTDEALRSTAGDSPKESSLLTPEPLGRTTLPTGQSAKNIGALDMDEESGNLLTPDGVDESFANNLSPDEYERYLATLDSDYKAPDYGIQDLGISQKNIDSFNENFNPVGGFTSQWQTVGSDRIMINDDGTAIGMNENGESYDLSPAQVQQMIQQGLLNTKQSGYVAATGGTGNRPGGSGPDKGGINWDKVADKLLTPKVGTMLAGAALGAASQPKGIDPRGLRSLTPGAGKQLVQTGAKGTGGRGSVRYFDKRAGGGAINGYAGGGGLGYLKGAHDGMADQINATIDNKRPAKLSGGEFVLPADVVSHLGNGNSEAGAKQLYALMERVRTARTGNKEQGKQINPKKYLPK